MEVIMNYKCVYCHAWVRSPITKKSNLQEDEDTNKKSKSKRFKHALIERKCIVSKKIMTIDSEACKYFKPAKSFRCNKNNQDVAFIACLHRRFNQDKLSSYEDCKKCRQFDMDIKPIMEDFWLNAKQIIEPKINKNKSEKLTTTKRVIKRRDTKETQRIIKRRNKVRSIKRRSTKETKRIIKRRK